MRFIFFNSAKCILNFSDFMYFDKISYSLCFSCKNIFFSLGFAFVSIKEASWKYDWCYIIFFYLFGENRHPNNIESSKL